MRKAVFVILFFCIASIPLTTFASGTPLNRWLALFNDNDDFFVSGGGNRYMQQDEPQLQAVCVTRFLPPRMEGLDIYGDVPELFTDSFSPAYYLINERIDSVIDMLISEARRVRARSITFSYKEYRFDGVVSILIEANVSSVISRDLVRSVNFRPDIGELVTIRDVVNFDAVLIGERILADRMRRSPENYYAAQAISLDSQAFFVDRQGITILFDEFQLSAMVSGVVPLDILRRNVRTVRLDASRVLLPADDANYDLLMVPLRYVATGLGYHVVWCSYESEASIYNRQGGHRLAWMQPGENEYSTPVFQRSLEAAPLLSESGIMYVPITFFEQILTLSAYTIDGNGNIIFFAYLN